MSQVVSCHQIDEENERRNKDMEVGSLLGSTTACRSQKEKGNSTRLDFMAFCSVNFDNASAVQVATWTCTSQREGPSVLRSWSDGGSWAPVLLGVSRKAAGLLKSTLPSFLEGIGQSVPSWQLPVCPRQSSVLWALRALNLWELFGDVLSSDFPVCLSKTGTPSYPLSHTWPNFNGIYRDFLEE